MTTEPTFTCPQCNHESPASGFVLEQDALRTVTYEWEDGCLWKREAITNDLDNQTWRCPNCGESLGWHIADRLDALAFPR